MSPDYQKWARNGSEMVRNGSEMGQKQVRNGFRLSEMSQKWISKAHSIREIGQFKPSEMDIGYQKLVHIFRNGSRLSEINPNRNNSKLDRQK